MKKKSRSNKIHFGPRYGYKPMKRYNSIVEESKKIISCPNCNRIRSSLKRKRAGLWQCKFCGYQLVGRAYSLS